MYRDKTKQRKKTAERVKRFRQKGVTSDEKGVTSYPDILDKLTDPVWRKRLEKICTSFNNSSANKADVYLGVPSEMFTIGGSNNKAYNLVEVCDLVEATR